MFSAVLGVQSLILNSEEILQRGNILTRCMQLIQVTLSFCNSVVLQKTPLRTDETYLNLIFPQPGK